MWKEHSIFHMVNWDFDDLIAFLMFMLTFFRFVMFVLSWTETHGVLKELGEYCIPVMIPIRILTVIWRGTELVCLLVFVVSISVGDIIWSFALVSPELYHI